MTLDKSNLSPRTRLAQLGREPHQQHGFINTPIYRGSTVLSPTVEHLKARKGYIYGTHGTPTIRALETAWSELAGAAGTVLVPTGLTACTLAILAVVKSGDEILVTDSVYRPTRHFCDTMLKRLGVTTRYYDPSVGAGIADLFQDKTTLVFTETPGSQSLEMQDIPAISKVAHMRGACVVMDNTWATPLFFSPHAHGVDLAIEAGTKFLSGHSDVLIGLVSANDRWYQQLRATFEAMAPCAGPEDVFLALRGMRSMSMRLKESEKQGMEMALWLRNRPEVMRVIHPALPDHPGHAIWKRDFTGASGLFTIVLQPHYNEVAIAAMLDGLQLFGMGYSWGGYESLVIPFDCSTYRTATQWQPGGPTLRFYIGSEDVADLQADLATGFERLNATR